jgi:hypothetical protein
MTMSSSLGVLLQAATPSMAAKAKGRAARPNRRRAKDFIAETTLVK